MSSYSLHDVQRERGALLAAHPDLVEARPVGPAGFVRLVDWMGSDARVVQAARVSYGAGTRTQREDAALIDYLLRNQHSSPFEQCEVTFHVKLPIYLARQVVRHRTASLNEISGRYSVLADEAEVFEPDAWRAQGTSNKQVGEGAVPEAAGAAASSQTRAHVERSFQLYHSLLESGVCREQARTVLPLATYTEWYWKMDLSNMFRFLKLRLDAHAQAEVRAFADAKLWFVERLFPACTAAFRRHVLEGESLSGPEAAVVKRLLADRVVSPQWLREELGEKEAGRFMARWQLHDVLEVVP